MSSPYLRIDDSVVGYPLTETLLCHSVSRGCRVSEVPPPIYVSRSLADQLAWPAARREHRQCPALCVPPSILSSDPPAACDDRRGSGSEECRALLHVVSSHAEYVATLFEVCDALFPCKATEVGDCCFTALDLLARSVATGKYLVSPSLPRSSTLTVVACVLIAWKFTTRDADALKLLRLWNRHQMRLHNGLGVSSLTVSELTLQEWDILLGCHFLVRVPEWWSTISDVALMFWQRSVSCESPAPQVLSRSDDLSQKLALLRVTLQVTLLQVSQLHRSDDDDIASSSDERLSEIVQEVLIACGVAPRDALGVLFTVLRRDCGCETALPQTAAG